MTPATVTSIAPQRTRPQASRPQPSRRPFRDNPRLILAGIAVLVSILVAIYFIANRTPSLAPDFLSEVVLYALSAADFTMLAALVFVLARNVIKLVVERRRALPFARFRARLVAVLLSMTIVPAVLVLIAGSEFIRTSIDNWFNAPMEDILASANKIAGDYYHERQMLVSDHATRLARELAAVDLTASDVRAVRDLVSPDVTLQRVKIVQVFRVDANGPATGVVPVVDVMATGMPTGYNRAFADRLAARVLGGQADTRSVEALGDSGDFLHAAAVI